MSSFPVAWILILITPYTPQSSSQILAELLRSNKALSTITQKYIFTTTSSPSFISPNSCNNSDIHHSTVSLLTVLIVMLHHERVRGCYVIIDAGIRCIIYCMYEDSTLEVTNWYLYPSSWHRFRLNSVKFCIILNLKAQPQNVIAVEYEIFQTSRRTNNIADFTFYTLVKAADSSMTTSFYGTYSQNFLTELGPDYVLVMESFSAPHIRYHEPINGVYYIQTLSFVPPAITWNLYSNPQPSPMSLHTNSNCGIPWSLKMY
ncbi:hypothetical protein F4703DRAFT_1789294 [Phycomyces blakesleeanus]